MKTLRSYFSHAAGAHIELVENEKAWRNKYAIRFNWQSLGVSHTYDTYDDKIIADHLYDIISLSSPTEINDRVWYIKINTLAGRLPEKLSFLTKILGGNEGYRDIDDAATQNTYEMDAYFSSFLGYNKSLDEEAELSMEECQELVDVICEDFDCDAPKLHYRKLPAGHKQNEWLRGQKKTEGVYFPYSDEVLLVNPTKTTLLHEMAHALDQRAAEPGLYQSHGAMFNRIYTQLLAEYAGHDAEIVVSYANQRNLYGPEHLGVDEIMAPVSLLYRKPPISCKAQRLELPVFNQGGPDL
ncbi:MAG: hypothetical protein CL565_01360 [Alphaproteobacteria bacterium]|nr:hypothetical protein [Alphaproteobacteria bacterium]|tara:strand:- start:101 stop:991 length:891 start_codon:yes stop_codon:yes gene_type:complete